MTSQLQQPIYLKGDGEPLFALLHPAAEPVRATAVLLCPPFGWDDMCSYRIRGEWAEQLARAGHTTLRIDLPGSGDSAGSPTAAGRLDAWTRAVEGAAGWLREHAGPQRRIAVLGIGLGGIVSCRAALAGAPIDELVLWSVPARGKRLLRELRTFAALEGAKVAAGRPAPDDDGLTVNGYLLSGATVAELERLDLGAAQDGESAPALARALVLGRDGLAPDPALAQALERAGATVTLADGPGYGKMMMEPQDARTPVEVFALVSSWLAEVPQAQAVEPTPASAPHQLVGGRAAARAMEDSAEMLTELDGVVLRERPIFFDGPTARLFGVLCEPVERRRELTAVLLNAGPQRRTGPNRMWVEIARRWAKLGVSTLRIDAAGMGDADGDGSDLARHTEFYRQGYVEQTRAAIDMLAARGLPQRYVTLGLCGGAYWSVHSALEDERVGSVILLNPRTLVFDEWEHTLRRVRQLRERALLPSTWRRAFSGELQLARHLETGRTLVGKAASAPTIARRRISSAERRPAAGDAVEDMFDALRDRDQRGLILFTGGEILHEELSQRGVFDHMERWPNLELVVLEDAIDAHTLTPLWVQREAHALVDRAVQAELDRLPVL
jgi:alpha-beta hydrolase superfamily lysophospholipase